VEASNPDLENLYGKTNTFYGDPPSVEASNPDLENLYLKLGLITFVTPLTLEVLDISFWSVVPNKTVKRQTSLVAAFKTMEEEEE
jgi:hypothetical protein